MYDSRYHERIGSITWLQFGRTRLPEGMTSFIMQPAPMTQLSPISAPFNIMALDAIQQFLPIFMLPASIEELAPSLFVNR